MGTSLGQEQEISLNDPYLEFLNYLNLSAEAFHSWQTNLQRRLPMLSQSLADVLNRHRDVGHFSTPPVTGEEIAAAILKPPSFNPHCFARFEGATRGDSRVYTPAPGGGPVEAKAPIDYSTWAAPEQWPGRPGVYLQKISASGKGSIDPHDSRSIWKARRNRQVDIFVNLYSPTLGIVNWSSFFQYQQLHMRAIGYEMGGRLLWFNQMLNPDMTQTIGPAPGQPGLIIAKDAFLVSVDFPLLQGGNKYFCVYGLYIDFDFDNGTATLSGPVFKMKNQFVSRGADIMTQEPSLQQSPSNSAGRRSTVSLPDMNAETYPFEVVQHALDEAAYFPLFSVAQSRNQQTIISPPGSSAAIGVKIRERLHRFSMLVDPSSHQGLRVRNTMGEPLARFEHRWMFAADGFGALPGVEPPPTPFDPGRSQRFVMLDSICTFDNGRDGFRGFGTGRTYPAAGGSRSQVLAAALGIITEGFGKFSGLQGIYTYCGSFSPDTGFTGSLLCRVMDLQGTLRTQRSLPELQAVDCPETDTAYLLFRGQKKNKHQKTGFIFGPNGEVRGFELHPQIRVLDIDCALDSRGQLLATSSIGPVIGEFVSYVFFNILNPGAPGTPTAPIRFRDYDNNVFWDRDGREIGSFDFDGGAGSEFGSAAPYPGEGQTFTLALSSLPGQQALRFGGYAPIVKGKGIFKGAQGLLADNSVVGVAPHAIATAYIARINDPECKIRSGAPSDRRRRYVCTEADGRSYNCEPGNR